MGKIHFTKEQEIILGQVKQDNFFTSRFYFTGGTALSSLYLNHRFSDDLDFFCMERFDTQVIFTTMKEWGRKFKFKFQSQANNVVYIFNLTFDDGTILKVDFGYYPYKRVEPGTKLGLLEVDSKFDIAINKLLTITQRSNAKDFVDLYFLLKKYSLWDLVQGVKVKFNMKIEPLLLAADFLKVEDFEQLPKMTRPLTLEQLRDFFRQQAKKISEQSIE